MRRDTAWHLLVDSGVRRGSDIVKAVALGASAVLSGRPTLGTAVAGQAGAAHVLDILRRETVSALGMVGCPDIRNVDRDLLSGLEGCPACPRSLTDSSHQERL